MNDEHFLALTMIGEARGETVEGIIGVGSTIRNRVISSKETYEKVCLAKEQFSCWNPNDPNHEMLLKLSNDIDQGNPINDIFLRQCFYLAHGIYIGDIRDNTNGAKNYVTLKRYQLARARQEKEDEWILKMRSSVMLGTQVFLV